MNDAQAVPFTVVFESSILRLGLFPDSRGYAQFVLLERGLHDWSVLSSTHALASEYIEDLCLLNLAAMHWITKHCIEITCEGRHLYYKLPEVRYDLIVAQQFLRSIPDVSGDRPSAGR